MRWVNNACGVFYDRSDSHSDHNASFYDGSAYVYNSMAYDSQNKKSCNKGDDNKRCLLYTSDAADE